MWMPLASWGITHMHGRHGIICVCNVYMHAESVWNMKKYSLLKIIFPYCKQARSANHGIVQEPSTGKSSEEDRQYLSHCALLPKSYFASRPPACLCWLYGRRRARGYPATRPMLVTILLKSSQYFIVYLLYLTIRSWYVLFLAPNALHAVTHSAVSAQCLSDPTWHQAAASCRTKCSTSSTSLGQAFSS